MIADPLFLACLLVGPAVFWRLDAAWRMPFLAALSFGYLCTISVAGTFAALAWTLTFFFLSPLARTSPRGRRITGALLLGILGYLVAFKYLPVFVSALPTLGWEARVILPLGISYYTFKLIHYAVEVGRARIDAHNLGDALAWALLFPAFTAGPIERFDHFLANRSHAFSSELLVQGGTRLIHGMIKKLFVADVLIAGIAGDVDGFLLHLPDASTGEAWRFCFLMFMFGYMDFSAYSDIAIGAARLFGIRLTENFDWPILAPSISNFWKRWHISLAQWVQGYVYMPFVGLTRHPYAATFLSFTTLGVWHGASWSWVLWGVYHATGVAVHLRWTRFARRRGWHHRLSAFPWRYAGIPVTMGFVTAAAAFTTTAAIGTAEGVTLFAKLFGVHL